jgi:hypothetical protein
MLLVPLHRIPCIYIVFLSDRNFHKNSTSLGTIHTWDATEEISGGHHSLNSTNGDSGAVVYVERLRTIPFDEDWILKADYRAEKREDGRWMCVYRTQWVEGQILICTMLQEVKSSQDRGDRLFGGNVEGNGGVPVAGHAFVDGSHR